MARGIKASKTYKVKWYDWHAGHYKEKECNREQLKPLFSKLYNKAGISEITITETHAIKLEN